MKRGRIWMLGTVAFAVIALGAVKVVQIREQVAFREELRLAQSDGIPVTAAAYAAMILPATPEENAADFYHRMAELPKDVPLAMKIEKDLLGARSPGALKDAGAYLDGHRASFDLIDQAALRPRCWFDRDWSLGAAVLMPEYSFMRGSARMVALRGSVAAVQGRNEDAIADANRIFLLSRHAGEEGHMISRNVASSMYQTGLRRLALWASMHPDVDLYRRRLAEAIDDTPAPDARREHASDLYQLLSLLEQVETARGRDQLGFKPEDIPRLEWAIPLMVNRGRARLEIVQAGRAYWKAIAGPTIDISAIEAARATSGRAMSAWPLASAVAHSLMFSDEELRPRERWAARRLQYRALLRALEAPALPRTLSTRDLVSPYDRKALIYKFDGKELSIAVSAPAGIEPPEPLVFVVQKGKLTTLSAASSSED